MSVGPAMVVEESPSLKEGRPGLGSYIWSILTGSGRKCRNKLSIRRKPKGNKSKEKSKSKSDELSALNKKNIEEEEDSDGDTFGIQKTERLKCFVKPRPPTNRRRPSSSAVSLQHPALSSSDFSLDEEEPLPSVTLDSIEEPPEAAQEEEEEVTQEPQTPPPLPTSPKPTPSASLASLKDIT